MKNAWIVASVFLTHAAEAGPSRTEFHQRVYQLHEKQIAQHTVRTEETTDDYNGLAAKGYSYLNTRYFDTQTGLLLSRIRRDAKAPEFIHIAEVNIYDANGRLIRDFVSAAPPWKPLHPAIAYINLHQYNGQLHSYRQFELDGQVNYEFCEGQLNGKAVRLSIDWRDMNKQTLSTPEYLACFDGMSGDWKRYTTPQ